MKRCKQEECKTREHHGSITWSRSSLGTNMTCLSWVDASRETRLHMNMNITDNHLRKLQTLYERRLGRARTLTDNEYAVFMQRVWSLLVRYRDFGKAGYQAALPMDCFRVLRRDFGVTHECCASPLNCSLTEYCSAFPDTDAWFGSLGNFLDFFPLSGSFECNPPFTDETIAVMALHMIMLCRTAEEARTAMSFVVTVPYRPDTSGYQALDTSKFTIRRLTLRAHDHYYKRGWQHIVPDAHDADVYRRQPVDTTIFFLQSTEGRKRWPVTEFKCRRLLEAFQLCAHS